MLPHILQLGHFKLKIVLADSEIVNEEYQGAYLSRDNKIILYKDLANGKGAQSINIILHELCHAIYYAYGLDKDSNEEQIVNAMSNGVTELLLNKELLKFINKEIQNENKNH